ncbi:MAG: hypothetical protein ACXW27_00315 [Allosphingosinicella sp.]
MNLDRVEVSASEGRITVAVPLGRDRPIKAPRRYVLLPSETIDDHLIGTRRTRSGEIDAERRLSFVRENLEMILRRAVQICEAKLVIGHPSIDGPQGNGLPDIIHIRPGEL